MDLRPTPKLEDQHFSFGVVFPKSPSSMVPGTRLHPFSFAISDAIFSRGITQWLVSFVRRADQMIEISWHFSVFTKLTYSAFAYHHYGFVGTFLMSMQLSSLKYSDIATRFLVAVYCLQHFCEHSTSTTKFVAFFST
jgi:hypothetical protein